MRPLLSLCLLTALTIPTHAALTLVVDELHQTVALTGSDLGTAVKPDNSPDPAIVTWEELNLGFTGDGTIEDSSGTSYTVASSADPPAIPNSGIDFSLKTQENNETFRLRLIVSAPGLLTITGTGTPFSYAHFDPGAKARLESLGGQQVSRKTGAGFSDLTIQVIPEPTPLLLVSLALGTAFTRRRR